MIVVNRRGELEAIIEQRIKEQGPNCDLNDIDVSEIEDMSWLFNDSKFNGDISEWDTSKVVSMYHMFVNSPFTGDISKWNTSRVKDMSYMFYRSNQFVGYQ